MDADAAPLVHLSLLNHFSVVRETVVAMSPAAKRLIAFVALQGGPRGRRFVAFSLWPDATERHAEANLRTVLWGMGRLADDIFDVGKASVTLRPAVQVDFHRLRRVAVELERGEPVEPSRELINEYACELLPDW